MDTDEPQIEEQAQQHEETNNSPKQGHSCFGFCCDMRRAVAIVNLLTILNFFVQVVLFVRLIRSAKKSETEFGEAFLMATTGIAIMDTIGWFISIFAFYGAYKYKWIPLAIQIVYTCIHWLVSNVFRTLASSEVEAFHHVWFNWILSLIISLLFIYPHVMLITELRSGIMAPETYVREKQSCCCV